MTLTLTEMKTMTMSVVFFNECVDERCFEHGCEYARRARRSGSLIMAG